MIDGRRDAKLRMKEELVPSVGRRIIFGGEEGRVAPEGTRRFERGVEGGKGEGGRGNEGTRW